MLAPLDRLVAEAAIRRRLLEYCRGIDRCDAEIVAGVYWPDGTDDHGSFAGLGTDFAVYATQALAQHALATTHLIGDTLFDWVDATSVDVETPVMAVHRCDGEYLERFAGRYFDRFTARDGDWRIAERRLTWDWDVREEVTRAFPPGRFTPSPRVRPAGG